MGGLAILPKKFDSTIMHGGWEPVRRCGDTWGREEGAGIQVPHTARPCCTADERAEETRRTHAEFTKSKGRARLPVAPYAEYDADDCPMDTKRQLGMPVETNACGTSWESQKC